MNVTEKHVAVVNVLGISCYCAGHSVHGRAVRASAEGIVLRKVKKLLHHLLALHSAVGHLRKLCQVNAVRQAVEEDIVSAAVCAELAQALALIVNLNLVLSGLCVLGDRKVACSVGVTVLGILLASVAVDIYLVYVVIALVGKLDELYGIRRVFFKLFKGFFPELVKVRRLLAYCLDSKGVYQDTAFKQVGTARVQLGFPKLSVRAVSIDDKIHIARNFHAGLFEYVFSVLCGVDGSGAGDSVVASKGVTKLGNCNGSAVV